MGTSKNKYKSGPTTAYKNAIVDYMYRSISKSQRKYKYAKGASCCIYATAVVRASGYDSSYPFCVKNAANYMKKSSKWKKISIKNAGAGDIFTYKNNNHIYIYGGKSDSKYIWYQANLNKDYGYAFYGKSPSSKTNSYAWHATGIVKK